MKEGGWDKCFSSFFSFPPVSAEERKRWDPGQSFRTP